MSSFRYLRPYTLCPLPIPNLVAPSGFLSGLAVPEKEGERERRETPFPRNDISKRNPGRSRAYSSRNGKGCTRRAPEGLRGYNEI